MQAAIEGKPYTQQYPIDATEPAFQKDIDASALWKKIVHNAWKSAEPGVLFWDTILKESVPDCYADLGYRTVSTNPCGEIPLCPYDSCRLLAINLYSYVVNPFKPDAYFDFELFKKHVALAQRIMDDIIDLELEKIERIMSKIDADPESEDVKHTERVLWQKIYKKSAQGRRTGVGITAEGDMLAPWDCVMALKRHRILGASTQDGGTQRLSLLHRNGQRTRRIRGVRYRTRKEQPVHQPPA